MKNLQMAYNAQQRGKKMSKGGQMGCMDCMAMGGKCMAHGGQVENEKMHPDMQVEMPMGMREDLDAMDDEGDNESEDGKRMAGGGMMGMPEDDMDEDDLKSMIPAMGNMSRGGSVKAGRNAMKPMGEVQSNKAKFADGGMVDEIMKDRKMRKMAEGGLLDANAEDDFDTRMDLEPVHNREDENHDVESSSLDDQSLVGQILRDRKKKRGME